jgi:hypothetical protein
MNHAGIMSPGSTIFIQTKVEVTRDYFLTPYREFENQLWESQKNYALDMGNLLGCYVLGGLT